MDNYDSLIKYHSGNCNRLVNGLCSTVRCMRRGGYVSGDKVDYDLATCEEYETVRILGKLRDEDSKVF